MSAEKIAILMIVVGLVMVVSALALRARRAPATPPADPSLFTLSEPERMPSQSSLALDIPDAESAPAHVPASVVSAGISQIEAARRAE